MAEQIERADLKRAEWQSELFAERPRRGELLKFRADWPLRTIHVRVHRNHAFEPVASMLEPYGAFGGWRAEFFYSDYSDALDFSENSGKWDAEELFHARRDFPLAWTDFSAAEIRWGDKADGILAIDVQAAAHRSLLHHRRPQPSVYEVRLSEIR